MKDKDYIKLLKMRERIRKDQEYIQYLKNQINDLEVRIDYLLEEIDYWRGSYEKSEQKEKALRVSIINLLKADDENQFISSEQDLPF